MCNRHWHQQGAASADFPQFIRHRHGGPFGGPFGGPRGPFGGPFGPGPRGRGRRRRGDVRTALLLLLAEEPRNGYQLMRDIEQRSEGRWNPSPGSVYPALSQLEDEGLITSIASESDPGRVYQITDAGRAQLAERGEQRPPWESEGEEDETLSAFRHAAISTGRAAWQVVQDGNPEQIARATELLNDTRRALYRLLAGDAER